MEIKILVKRKYKRCLWLETAGHLKIDKKLKYSQVSYLIPIKLV